MKKVITMVGTSIFENYFEKNEARVNLLYIYREFKNKPLKNEGGNESNSFKNLINSVKNWAKETLRRNFEESIHLSAEAKSIVKIKETVGEDIEVYLLSSYTYSSKIAGEMLAEFLPQIIGDDVAINRKEIVDLVVDDRNRFLKGISNLIEEIYRIAAGNWDNIIINITGGFKATIPFLTILAQLNSCPIFYIFE
ncbi:MAG: putative CRISPR-associated protein, partial [Candidatus Hadarchaeales archaeon]